MILDQKYFEAMCRITATLGKRDNKASSRYYKMSLHGALFYESFLWLSLDNSSTQLTSSGDITVTDTYLKEKTGNNKTASNVNTKRI